MKIPLFDLDWTLIAKDKVNVHSQAFYYAFEHIYGIKDAKKENVEGRIDNQIIIETLTPHGISAEVLKEKLPEATKTMSDYFLEHINEGTYPVLPGVKNLLTQLKQNNIPIGLLTGNVEAMAWAKLKKAGIRQYFDFGAFGDQAFKRVDLVKIARKNAEKVLARTFEITDFIIIGDTPRDIQCARDAGIQVIAVASGPHTFEELASSNPDLLLHTLEESEKVIRLLEN